CKASSLWRSWSTISTLSYVFDILAPLLGAISDTAPTSIHFCYKMAGEMLPRSSHRNYEISINIDLHRVAGHQHRGGSVFLDQGRSLDAVAGKERGAPIGRRRAKASAEIDWPLAAECRGGRNALAARDLALRRLAHQAGDGRAQADDLGAFFRRRSAVALRVHFVEVPLDGFAVAACEHGKRQIDRHRVLLADITHVG